MWELRTERNTTPTSKTRGEHVMSKLKAIPDMWELRTERNTTPTSKTRGEHVM